MDLYSRKIISWEVSDSLSVEIVLKTVAKAKSARKLGKALIIYSDRGSQYTSKEDKNVTRHPKIERSYSRKGNTWDNAVIESFHSIIKREWLNRYRIRGLLEAKSLIFEYIETFYNSRSWRRRGIEYGTTRPYSPWENGKVERSHRLDSKYYADKKFKSKEELLRAIRKYNTRYSNISRKVLGFKSPNEVLKEYKENH